MKPFAVSWSKLSTYETCPRKFWLLYGSKHVEGEAIIPFQSSKALDEGNLKHSLLENAINSLKKGLFADSPSRTSPSWQPWWGDFIIELVKKYPQSWVEQKLAVDTDFQKCVLDKYWRPSMTNQTVLFQGRLDAVFFNDRPLVTPGATTASLIDWKSGQVREASDDSQLGTQALLLFAAVPSLETIKAAYVFIDHKKSQKFVFERKNFKKMRENLEDRIDTLMSNFGLEFDCKPNNCRWCPATKEHCDYAR